MENLVTTLNSWTETASDYAKQWKESATDYSKLWVDFTRLNKEILLMAFDPNTYSDPVLVESLRAKVVSYHELRSQLFGRL